MLTVLIILLVSSAGNSQETEKVKLMLSTGIESFVKDLNDNGKRGYRLENSVSYGGEGITQNYAAIALREAGTARFQRLGSNRKESERHQRSENRVSLS